MWRKHQASQAGKPLQLQTEDLGDRGRTPDDRHAAFVEVMKRLGRVSGEPAPDRAGHVPALLHGDGADAGQRSAALVREEREIADHEDLGVARDGEVGLDHDAAVAVERHSEEGPDRRRRDARGPEHGRRVDALAVPDRDSAGVDRGDRERPCGPPRRDGRARLGHSPRRLPNRSAGSGGRPPRGRCGPRAGRRGGSRRRGRAARSRRWRRRARRPSVPRRRWRRSAGRGGARGRTRGRPLRRRAGCGGGSRGRPRGSSSRGRGPPRPRGRSRRDGRPRRRRACRSRAGFRRRASPPAAPGRPSGPRRG